MAMAISARCSTARRMEVVQGRGFAAAQRQLPPELAQRTRRCVDSGRTTRRQPCAFRVVGCAPSSTSGPGPAGRITVSAGHHESAPGQCPHGAVERHLQRGRTDDEHDQRADEPAHRQPQQRARGHHGADDEVDRHEGQQQRPPPPPPPRGQPRARHREHRGEHRDPPRVVEELRQNRVEPFGQIEVPSRRRDAVAGDRQREDGDDPGGGVRAEQLPLPREDQADQDHERQRQDRDAVDQIDRVGLGGGQHPDDLGDGSFQSDPLVSGDQRTGDRRRRGTRPRAPAAGCRWSVGSTVAAGCRRQ